MVGVWQRGGKKQVIGQGELFPVLLSRRVWKDKMVGRRIFAFIDNDSARDSLIAAYSPSLASMDMLYLFLQMDLAAISHWWFARVPSKSNPSDGPSRLFFEDIAKWLNSRKIDVEADLQALLRELVH